MGNRLPARSDERTHDTTRTRDQLRGASLTHEQRVEAAEVVERFLGIFPEAPGACFLRAAAWGLRQDDLTLAQVIDQADAWRDAGGN